MDVYAYTQEIYNKRENGVELFYKVKIDKGNTDTFQDFLFAMSDTLNCTSQTTPDMNLRYLYKTNDNGKGFTEIGFSTKIKFQELTTEEQIELDEFSINVVEKAKKYDSDVDKLRVVNEEILEHVSYDFDIDIQETTYKDAVHTAYGAVATKKAVCMGYANLFAYVVGKLDIPVIKVTGHSNIGEAHIWNAVYIEKDGVLDWYYVDATWNDVDDNKHFLTTAKRDEDYKSWDKEVEKLTIEIKYPEINERKFIEEILGEV